MESVLVTFTGKDNYETLNKQKILLNRMSKVSSLGKTESAETAAAATVEFDESVLSLITERIICS